MPNDPRLLRRFQEEISQLVDQYLLDGLSPNDVILVLQQESTNDVAGRLKELREFIAATQQVVTAAP
jgi:hypothetical protein